MRPLGGGWCRSAGCGLGGGGTGRAGGRSRGAWRRRRSRRGRGGRGTRLGAGAAVGGTGPRRSRSPPEAAPPPRWRSPGPGRCTRPRQPTPPASLHIIIERGGEPHLRVRLPRRHLQRMRHPRRRRGRPRLRRQIGTVPGSQHPQPHLIHPRPRPRQLHQHRPLLTPRQRPRRHLHQPVQHPVQPGGQLHDRMPHRRRHDGAAHAPILPLSRAYSNTERHICGQLLDAARTPTSVGGGRHRRRVSR